MLLTGIGMKDYKLVVTQFTWSNHKAPSEHIKIPHPHHHHTHPHTHTHTHTSSDINMIIFPRNYKTLDGLHMSVTMTT